MGKMYRKCYNTLVFTFLLLFFQTGFCNQLANIQQTEQQLNASLKNKDWHNASGYSFTLATHYWQGREVDQAIHYLEQCLTYSKKANNQQQLHKSYQQLGQIYTETGNYSKALGAYQKGLKLAKELHLSSAVLEGLLQVSSSYQLLKKPRKSIEYLKEALSHALRQNRLDLQEKCYEKLAELFEQLGEGDKATEYHNLLQLVKNQQQDNQTEKQLIVTKESLHNTKKSLEKTAISLQQAKEINEKRQLEIALLSKDKALAELQIKEQQARIEYTSLIRNSSIAGLLMALALITLMLMSHRRKQEANAKIEKQNKNISSSINYARRIQEAMLPTYEQQQRLLPAAFVLFKPRDAVSGDFYLITELQSSDSTDVVIAAADCTGHGVPGAFMSLIGINALHGIINRGVNESNLILEALDTEIRKSLQQETSGNNDGMDIALCLYHRNKNILKYAGAKNPLVYIQHNELFQIKGDIQSIGGRKGKKERAFMQHLLAIDQPTTVYLFSDGFRDQFGDQDKGKFMSKRFNQLLLDIHQLPLPEQQQILSHTLADWKGNAHQTDDVLVIGFKLEPVG